MMTKNPYSLTFVVLCLFFAVIATPSFGEDDPNWVSSNWPGSWEGDERPYNGGAGDWAVYWFDCDPCDQTTYEASYTTDGSSGFVTFGSLATLWYQSPSPITDFNFDGGVSFEWRIKSLYGTANSGQNFFAVYDYNLDKNIRFTFTYPDGPNMYGLINVGGVDYPFLMHSSVPGNDFHKFRVTVLGSVVKLYIDDNPDEVLTGVTISGQGSGVNGLAWGDKLMQTDFDYIRWTTEGAFAPPPPAPPAAPSKFSFDWEGKFEMNAQPLASGTWASYWMTQGEDDVINVQAMPYETEPGNPYKVEPDNNMVNFYQPTGAMWYKWPTPMSFDFTTGSSIEQRVQELYGTMGQSSFFSAMDTALGTSVTLRFSYTNSNPFGELNLNGMIYPFFASSSMPSNPFHIFRVTVLGTVVKLYIDNSLTPAITTTTAAGAGWSSNGFGWGNSIITNNWDYLRWTSAGALSPPTECELLWEGTLAGPEQDLNHDCSVDMLDLYELVAVWLNCNDPAGCP